MSALDQIQEMLELMGIKAMLEGITKPITETVRAKLAEVGIEAEVKFELEVKSVNLDTFREKRSQL